jgi:hypothetical protein
MDALKGWMQQPFTDKQVEPNSRLGQAFNYVLKRWAALTGFLRIAGNWCSLGLPSRFRQA